MLKSRAECSCRKLCSQLTSERSQLQIHQNSVHRLSSSPSLFLTCSLMQWTWWMAEGFNRAKGRSEVRCARAIAGVSNYPKLSGSSSEKLKIMAFLGLISWSLFVDACRLLSICMFLLCSLTFNWYSFLSIIFMLGKNEWHGAAGLR